MSFKCKLDTPAAVLLVLATLKRRFILATRGKMDDKLLVRKKNKWSKSLGAILHPNECVACSKIPSAGRPQSRFSKDFNKVTVITKMTKVMVTVIQVVCLFPKFTKTVLVD